jgi:hypothetical protein
LYQAQADKALNNDVLALLFLKLQCTCIPKNDGGGEEVSEVAGEASLI